MKIRNSVKNLTSYIYKNNLTEIICFCFFCIGVIFLSFFHEPCFDEFQAWGISKDSIYNILFVIPHFEGHPPLWYLILKCFSFFNVNCELGIKIPNLLFMFGAVRLLIFKSPFPRAIRLALPFTYFIFYQYSIISRPYSIFCFAIFLAAYFHKERNEHPFKFISALALLCLSCAYGMVISTGIIIAWFIEIIRTKKIIEFFKDKRFFSMLIIFLLCSGLVLIIIPDKNILYLGGIQQLTFPLRFLTVFFILPADSLFLNTIDYSLTNVLNGNSFVFISSCLSGYLLILLSFYVFKAYKKLLLFFIPYLMLITMFLCIYMYPHHIGILTLFYIFALWCALSETNFKPDEKIKKISYYFIFFVILTQLIWSISASYFEIKYPYLHSREMAEFIKQNKLDNYKILCSWYDYNIFINKKNKKIIKDLSLIPKSENDYFYKNFDEFEKGRTVNLYHQGAAVVINSYFNKNIFSYFNIDNPEKQYIILKKMTEQEFEYTRQLFRQIGVPDIIIKSVELDKIYDKDDWLKADYIFLKEFCSYQIWKNTYKKDCIKIYIKKDLYNKLFKQEAEQRKILEQK